MGGQLQRGANGFAGEIGHMVVERNGVGRPMAVRIRRSGQMLQLQVTPVELSSLVQRGG